MSQSKERVYPPDDSVRYSSSSQPYKKSRAPPPPSAHRNAQPSVHSKDYRDYHKPKETNPKYDDQSGHNKRQYENYDKSTSKSAPSQPRRSDYYTNDPSRNGQDTSRKNQGYKSTHHESASADQRRGDEKHSKYNGNQEGVESGKHQSSKSSWEPKSQRQQQYNSNTGLHEIPSKQWVPKSQREDPGGNQYKSQQDLTAGYKNTSGQQQYASQSDLSKRNASSSWEPRAQRKDGQQYHSQHDLSVRTKQDKGHQQYRSQKDLSKNPPTSWEPQAQRKDGHKYHSQHDLSVGTKQDKGQQQYTSQKDLNKNPPTSWEPRAQRPKTSGDQYQSQQDLRATSGSLSKSQQSLPAASQGLTTGQSMTQLAVSNPVDIKADTNDGRRYQRNSAHKPQQNRQSSNLGHVPAASTQSLHNPRSLGHTNPALARSAVSLNPSANAATLAGQADLSGGLSTSRLSLASRSISRNPSLASLVASNPSLYRTVSTFSLYEAGMAEPSTYLPVTIAGCILCCPIGVIGILFSVMARDALEVKDYPRAVRWGSIALWTGVAFIIGGIVLILTLSLILGLYYST